MDCLVVLDFEWTADDTVAMLPIPEITQFPSVLVRLSKARGGGRTALAVDQFNSYVRPELNPVLTDFSIQLTGIQQVESDYLREGMNLLY
jgi:inhibitor of KinA sporulation pathway (predicted exonuclease)